LYLAPSVSPHGTYTVYVTASVLWP